jgi:inner membrane protein
MDPLTQGVLGAALPQATSREKRMAPIAGLCGAVGGMAADLDVLIASKTDPLLFLEYHRQFTHSLIFIPIGGLICALALHLTVRRWWKIDFKYTYLFATLGYATHGLLDACTSYGTLLFWPFSDSRVDWSIISIIDPLFTVPLLAAVIMAAVKRKPKIARVGLAWCGVYLLVGLIQRESAEAMAAELALKRGHTPTDIQAKPSFGNLIVWKTIYEAEGRFYVDAARVGFAPKVFEGGSVSKLDLARDFPWLQQDSQQARDVKRFAWFSQDYVARDESDPARIIDIRYSLLPNDINALWSITLDPKAGPEAHTFYQNHRNDVRESGRKLWQMMTEP